MRAYIILWLACLGLLGYEYYAITFKPALSILLNLQSINIIEKSVRISTEPGRPLSLWLGWIGIGLMVTMNVYSIRKRTSFLSKYGKLSSWLNFHIFCGLLGPTMIFFHSNFNARGIVAISFWSMIVSFSSGIIGRYFYVQLLRVKKEYDELAEKRKTKLAKILEGTQVSAEAQIQQLQKIKQYVGIPESEEDSINPFFALFLSLKGDIKLLFKYPDKPRGWPAGSQFLLVDYAINKRKSVFLEPFNRLMGYWHAFHFPFAVFMYITAVIHIISALIFLKS